MNTRNHQFPRRPPRLPVLFDDQPPLFFITFNTYARKKILHNAQCRETFIDFCEASPRVGVVVGEYVIMPDHIHLFVWLNRGHCGLPKYVKSLKERLGKTFLAQEHDKPHWQQGFFDHLLRRGESYQEKCQYVAMNPVRADLCQLPEEWPYRGKIHDVEWFDER